MSRVLILEPDPGLRETLDLILRMAGYCTETATGGEEALALALVHPSAAIVLATALPGFDGSGFITAYRSACGSDSAPVVVMTHDQQEAAVAREVGADAVLPMPFDAADLLTAVQRVVRLGTARRSARNILKLSVPSTVGSALTA